MIIINTVDEKYFELNGIQFARIYQPLAQGSQAIGIYSIYDTRQQLVNSTKYDEFTINGVVYMSQEDAIKELSLVIWLGLSDYDVEQLDNRVEAAETEIENLDVRITQNADDIDANELRIDDLEENQTTGVEVYSTLADLPATGTLLVSYKVSNDPTPANNGYYHWTGSAYLKDANLYSGVVESGEVEAVTGDLIYEYANKLSTLYDVDIILSFNTTDAAGWYTSELIFVSNITRLNYSGQVDETQKAVSFYDKDGVLISDIAGTGASPNAQVIEFDIPEDCVSIQVIAAFAAPVLTVVTVDTKHASLLDIINKVNNNIHPYISAIGKYLPDGVDVGGSLFETPLIPIPDKSTFEFYGNARDTIDALEFYDINQVLLETVKGVGASITIQTIIAVAPENVQYIKARYIFSTGTLRIKSQEDTAFMNLSAINGINQKFEEATKQYKNNLINEEDSGIESTDYGQGASAIYKFPLTNVKRVSVDIVLPRTIHKTASDARILQGYQNDDSVPFAFFSYHSTPSQIKSVQGKVGDNPSWSLFPECLGGLKAPDWFRFDREAYDNKDSLGDRTFSLWFKGFEEILTEPTPAEITARSAAIEALQDMYIEIITDTLTIGRDGVGEDDLPFNGGATSVLFTTSLKDGGNYKLVSVLYEELLAAGLTDFYIKEFAIPQDLTCEDIVQFGKFKLVGKYNQQTTAETDDTNNSILFDSFPLFVFAINREIRVRMDLVISEDGTEISSYVDGLFNTTFAVTENLQLGHSECDVVFENLEIYKGTLGGAEIIDEKIVTEETPLIIGLMGHVLDDTYEGNASGYLATSISKLINLSKELREKGFNILSSSELAEYYKGFRKLPAKNAFLYVDDYQLTNWFYSSKDRRSSFMQTGLKVNFSMVIDQCIDNSLSKDNVLTAIQNGCSFVNHSYYHDVAMPLKTSMALFYELMKAREYMDENYFNQDVFVFDFYGGRRNAEVMIEYCGYSVAIDSSGEQNSKHSNKFRLRRLNIDDLTAYPNLG